MSATVGERLTTTRTLLLLVLFVGVIAVATTAAQGPKQAQVGGFVVQVPENQTPNQPTVNTLPPGHRRIYANLKQTLAAQLRPDDQVLEVVTDGHYFVGGHDIPDVEIAGITMFADAVALVDVTAKQGALTASGGWVTSTLTVAIDEVLKDATGRLVAGQSAAVKEQGGSVLIGQQRVIAYFLSTTPTEVGRRYLAALTLNQDTDEWGLVSGGSFEVNGQAIRRLRLDASPKWTLDRHSLDWVKERVNKNAHLRRPRQ